MESHPSVESDCSEFWRHEKFQYGAIQLSGYRVIAGKNPKYVRVHKDLSNIKGELYKLMTNVWGFKKPKLIISLNGGAKNMIPLNNDQKLAFKRGLIDVSKSASTWIVTGGFETGVSKLVGEASKDYSILSKKQTFTVLGIGTWGATYNKEKLAMQTEDDRITYPNYDPQKVGKGQSPLDPYHDAFILYDDGSDRKFGREIKFRTEFEESVSKEADCSVVQLIVEGGKNTIQTGAEALKSNIPVVVMKGSKRAADVICDVVESSSDMFQDTIKLKLEEFEKEWNITTDEEKGNFQKNLVIFYECYQIGKVHLFNMKDFKNNLDTAIIEAAFSGTIKDQPLGDEAKLWLAMTFNRADVAEQRIFENQVRKNEININLRPFMETALIRNQWQFVDFFLRQGLTVESFLTNSMLRDLYFKEKANAHLHTAVNFIFKGTIDSPEKQSLKMIGRLINQLTDNLFPQMYQEANSDSCSCCCWKSPKISDSQLFNDSSCEVIDYEKYIEPVATEPTTNCCCCFKINGDEESSKEMKYTVYPIRNKNKQIIYTEQDLFLWALLTQRIEMAKIFWKCGKDHIGSALVATVVCSSLQKKAGAKGEIEIMNNWMRYQEEFETLAINILSEAYRRDQIRTHLLLIRALPYWGRESCLDIANKNQLINFLFHSACQTRLNNIWLGKIPNFVNIFQILINVPFGYLTSRIFIFPYNLLGKRQTQAVQTNNSEPGTELLSKDFSEHRQKSSEKIIQPNYTLQFKKIKKKLKIKEDFKRTEYLSKFRKEQHESLDEVGFCSAIRFFYTAPITKFVMNIISYLAFLTMFSYFLLIELNTITLSPTAYSRKIEYCIYIFYISFLLGEIYQFFMGGQVKNFISKFNNWKSSMWNWFDLGIYIVFTIAYILRNTVNDSDFIYCRTLFSISLSMFYIRFMEFYYVQQSVGPKVIMISRMLKDILFFLAIYLIALFAYGTFSMSLLYPNINITSPLMRNIFYNPYWQLFGQVDTSYMEGSQCLFGYCATPNAIVQVANAFFLLFTNVLLLSLLIAMFGVTFMKVEENSNRVWAFTRYRMIEEFYYRPILPPPFNVFEVFYNFFKLNICKNSNNGRLSVDAFIANLIHEEDLECSGFEQQCMETYLITNQLLDLSAHDASKACFKSDDSITNEQSNVAIEAHVKALVGSIAEIKDELKSLNEKVYKIRRLQKKTVISGNN